MDRWIVGQMNIWIDKYIDRQIYGQINIWIDKYMDRLIDGQMDRWKYGYMDIFIYVSICRLIDKNLKICVDKRIAKQID